MKVPKWDRTWIPGIVFWVLFLASLALGKRYPWLDSIWYAAWMLFLLVIAVHAGIHIFRKRKETDGYVGYRGVPRWAVTVFGDDVRPDKPTDSSKIDPHA
jgi:hypothetical protein